MMEEISRNELRRVRSLHQKKFRAETGLFVAEGRKVVEEALRSGWFISRTYTTDPDFAKLHPSAVLVRASDMEQLSALQTPPGYLSVVRSPDSGLPEVWPDRILALDGIRDPGNAGTMVRTADWFGVRTIISQQDAVEWFNPKLVQATMGSIFRVRTTECALGPALASLHDQGYAIIGADMEGTPIGRMEWPERMVLVLGSESHGIREEIAALLTHQVTIPGSGSAESLNVAVAAGIILSRLFQAPDPGLRR